LGGRGRRISEFEASLVYRVSSRTARATGLHRETMYLKKIKKKKKKEKKRKKKKKKERNSTKLYVGPIKSKVSMNCFCLKWLESELTIGLPFLLLHKSLL
jgi:hypothetical protein